MKFNDMFPIITYINLDTRNDRRILIEEELNKLEVSYNRTSGKLVAGTGSHYWDGVAGCAISHITILRDALEKNKSVFIFEDDAKLINNFDEIIPNALDELNTTKWDCLYMGANIYGKHPTYQVSDHLGKLSYAQSTVAYGVNINFIEQLLKMIPLDRIIPIDMIYTSIVPNVNAYITVPMTAVQRKGYSDIEGQEVEYETYLEKRYWDNFVPLKDGDYFTP
jgi:GR25 family glycosyltransferase involved in LPS biosynthesis